MTAQENIVSYAFSFFCETFLCVKSTNFVGVTFAFYDILLQKGQPDMKKRTLVFPHTEYT